MDLRDFIRREGTFDVTTLTTDGWTALEEGLAEASVHALAQAPPEDSGISALPAPSQRSLLFALGRYRKWRNRCDASRSAFVEALGEEDGSRLLDASASPEEIDVLQDWLHIYGPRLANAGEAALELRRRAISVALKDAVLHSNVREGHDLEENFDEFAGFKEQLEKIPPHRWMAIRRGQTSGALTFSFDLPEEALAEQFALLKEELAPLFSEQSAEEVFRTLLLTPLPAWLERDLGEKAGRRSIEGACRAYGDLLATPAIKARAVAGVFVAGPRGPLGVAVVNATGELVATARIAPTEGWQGRLDAWLRSEDVKHVSLPTHASSTALLTELRKRLSDGRTLVLVRPAGLSEARERILSGRKRITPEAASAAVLAMRAAQPAVAWRAVDPVRLGLAEYQADLDEKELSEALRVTRAVADRVARPMTVSSPDNTSASGAWDTPLVKTLADLRPGMMVPAVITNLTNFGAFADIGVGHQGLIHISDLADHFVENPADVVRAGQKVRARVLNVDVGRGRISLSLKSESSSPGPPGSRVSSGRPRGSAAGKSQALRDLENLFDR